MYEVREVTVPTFNFCNKCVVNPYIIHNCTSDSIAAQFPGNGCKDDLTTEHSFESQATWVIVVFVFYFRHVIHGCLYNQDTGRQPVDWCRNLMPVLYGNLFCGHYSLNVLGFLWAAGGENFGAIFSDQDIVFNPYANAF